MEKKTASQKLDALTKKYTSSDGMFDVEHVTAKDKAKITKLANEVSESIYALMPDQSVPAVVVHIIADIVSFYCQGRAIEGVRVMKQATLAFVARELGSEDAA